MRKRIALLLIVSTAILGLSACGNGEKNQTQAGEGQAAEEQADEALDSGGQVSAETETGKEPVELTVFINGLENPSDWEWGQDPSSQKITEDTGVTFKLQYASDIDNTEIMTMLASGEELPDIIVTNAHGAVRPMLVDQGFVLLEGMNIFDEVVYETIEFPMPEGRTQEQMKIHDDYYAIGTTGVFVTKDTAYPDRCIQYITYMMGLDGQLLQRYGREGVTWEKDEEGRPKSTELKNKVEKEDFAKLQREYGVYNYDFSWFTSQWILAYGAHNTYQDFPAMLPDFEIMTPHQQNERFADLTYTLKDTEALALKEQIYQLWASGVARICTTESDQDFENEYEKFLSDMQTAGVETLNTYYQENAEHWKEVGFVME